MARPGNNKKSNFIVQGGLLGMAGIITRIIGMIYRIPVTNIIGDKGNGYYASAYYIYNIMLLISSYSLPLAISKVVSARLSKRQYRNAARVFKGGLFFATITGGLAGLVVLFGADLLAESLQEPLSAIALRIFAPTLLIVAVMGVFRGYFQGMGNMVPTAVSQIIEQIINAVISIIAAKSLFDYGIKTAALLRNEDLSYAYGAAGSTLGTSVGAFSALLFLVALYFLVVGRLRKRYEGDDTAYVESYGSVMGLILMTVFPVILSTAIYNINDILDNYIFNHMMEFKGFGSEKTAIWGIYTGKAKLLLNVPIALANSISASAVPALASCIASDNIKGARKRISAAMRFTMIISFPCAVGLFVLADPIINLLFSGETVLAAALMRAGAATVMTYSVSTLSNGMLQGIGKMNLPVKNAAISLVLHLISLTALMYYTDLGIYAVVISTVVFSLSMCFLNSLSLRHAIAYRQEKGRTFVIPALSAGVMGVVIFVIWKLLSFFTGYLIQTLLPIAVGMVVYFIFILKFGAVREDELYDIPMGGSIVRTAKSFGFL
ncbi:MAG: polysaccharide biosynthesis protein [Lachnospiraceae bacterium]|nr:polysaccharide biosynthesis protein [Lachnospiraceae bacterium]